MTDIGPRIRQLRARAGLSQTQLAGDGLSPSYISLLEAGKRQPSFDVLAVLAERLGCAVGDLAGAPDRNRFVDLEMAYARLALANGEAPAARTRLEALEGSDLDAVQRDHVRMLLAEALDKCNDLGGAARVIYPVYERALDRRSHLPAASVSLSLCGYYLRAGDLHAAVRIAERGLAAVEQHQLVGSDEHLRLAATLMWAHYELGDFAHCVAWSEQLLALAEEHGSAGGQAAIYWNAAMVAEAQGRVDEALTLCDRALARLSEQGTDRNLPRLHILSAWFMMRADAGRAAEAAAALDQVLPLLQDVGGPLDIAVWGSRRALAELLMGNAETAEELSRQALLHLSAHASTEGAEALVTLGDALVAQGRTEEAQVHYHAAGETLKELPVTRHVAALWCEIADRRLLSGKDDDAIEAYRKALAAGGIRSHRAAAEVAFGLRAPAPAGNRAGTRLDGTTLDGGALDGGGLDGATRAGVTPSSPPPAAG